MRKLFTALALAASVTGGGAARAADHRDGPAASADPTTDITDVYTWMTGDGAKVNLVLDIEGGAMGATKDTKFSNTALFAFHITSSAKALDMAAAEQLVVCSFSADATQKFQCWGPGGEYVTDVTGNTGGTMSASGKMKVFAGLRDDPFYFNIRGFRATAGAVNMAAGALMFDPAGCPKIDMATSATLVGLLKSDGKGGAPTDDFSAKGMNTPALNGNVLSIAIQIDKTLLTTKGGFLGVWASTNKTK